MKKSLKPVIMWEAHEYIFREKTNDWYWAVGIIGACAAIVALVFGNILFGLLLIVATFTLCLYGAKKPVYLHVEVNHSGVMINRVLYPYITLKSFWVDNNSHLGTHSRLVLKSKKIASQMIVIPLNGVHPEELRDFLLDHIPEAEHVEPLAHHLLQLIGF
jgi:hypothetical protein